MTRFVPPRRSISTSRPAVLAGPARSDRARGFTLVELLTVIVIIVILMGIALGVSKVVVGKQNEIKAQGELSALALQLESFKSLYGEYPPGDSPTGTNSPAAEQNLAMALTGRARWYRNSAGTLSWDYVTMDRKFNDGGTTNTGQVYNWGKAFIEEGKFTIESDPSTATTFNANARILDPWGQPYLYRYKLRLDVTQTVPSKVIWQNISYVLLSVGPDSLPGTGNEDDAFPWQQPVNGHSGATGVLPPNYLDDNTNHPYNADNLIQPPIN